MKKVFYIYYPNDSDKMNSLYLDITSPIRTVDLQPIKEEFYINLSETDQWLPFKAYINDNKLNGSIISILLYSNSITNEYLNNIESYNYIKPIKDEYGLIDSFILTNQREEEGDEAVYELSFKN